MMIKWAVLLVYLCVMVGIGAYCRHNSKDVSSFVLGGRNLGAWFTAFAYGTSYFSAVVFIGYAGQFGWTYGVSATWIGIGNALIGSLLAWIVLGERTRKMTKHLNAATLPEFFEKRYQSNKLKTVSAMIVFIFLIPYTASVYNGLSRLFEILFNIDYSVCIIIMAVLTAVYVIMGGYLATAINDFVQGLIMLAGIIAVIVCTLANKGGLFSSIVALTEAGSDAGYGDALGSLFGPDPINLVGVVILTSLGTWGLPQMIHKFYTIKDSQSIKRGAIISTFFALVVAGGSYFLGAFGRLFVTAEDITTNGVISYDKIVPTMISSTLPDILLGIVVVLVLSASMSTLSSLVLTSSSTITIDLIKPRLKQVSEDKLVKIIRVFIAVFLLISVFIALNPNTYITTLMSISWGALAGAFLAPFLYGLFSKKITTAAVSACFISGVGITVMHMFLFSLGLFPSLVSAVSALGCPVNLLSPINAGAFAMLLGLILVPIVSKCTKVDNVAAVDRVFDCYRLEK